MGRVNKEYKFNNLKGLNTLIDTFGLDKGEAYYANNIIFSRYGDKILAKCRPALGTLLTGLTATDVTSLGYVNIKKLADDSGASNYSSTIGLIHYNNGNLDALTQNLGHIETSVLTKLPGGITTVSDLSEHCPSLTFGTLNDTMFLTAPKSVFKSYNCDSVTGFTAFGAEAGAIATDLVIKTAGIASNKTTITNSNATENGIYFNMAFNKTLALDADIYISDITDIANIRVAIFQDTTETNGEYWDFTYQSGGQDLVTGWNKITVNIDDSAGTDIGTGLVSTGTVSGRCKISAITSANATYDLHIDNIIIGNQTAGLHTSTTALAWTKIYSASEALPNFDRMTIWDGRVFGIYRNRLYWSNINDGKDFWHAIDTETKKGDTNTSTLVNGLNSTANLKVGLRVTSSTGDIPSGTVITEITSSTSVTISVAATATNADQDITFQGAPSDDSNWMELDDGEGDYLTALTPISNSMMLLLKTASLHRIRINTSANAASVPYIREPVYTGSNQAGIGCISPNTVQHILVDGIQNEAWGASEYIIFLSKRDVYAIGSVGGPINLSIKLPELADSLITPGTLSLNYSVVDPVNKVYYVGSSVANIGYAYSIQAKSWSTFTVGTASRKVTAACNIPLIGSDYDSAKNRVCFGENGGTLMAISPYAATSDAIGSYTATIKYSMYDYNRERFYKLLMNTSSILESYNANIASVANITVTVENEEGSTTSTTITPTLSPKYYDCPAKIYGTHFSQQYDLSNGGVLHRFIHEIKHTNNKKGA